MAGAVNIRVGVNVSDLVAGFKTAGSASAGFTAQTKTNFASLAGAASPLLSGIGDLNRQLAISKTNIASLVVRGAAVPPEVLSSFRSLQSLSASVKSTLAAPMPTSGFSSLSSSLLSVKGLLGGAFAIGGIKEFASELLGVTGKFERYRSVLTNALQSSTEARESLKVATGVAGNSPFGVDELTESLVKFVNRGLTPTKAQLVSFGDLAASQGKGFDQLTEAILDAQSGEFERLKEFGIRAAKSGDQVTLSFKGITQTVRNSSEEITKAIVGFGQLNGVAGSMAAVSQTLEGQISNLGDAFDRLLVAAGDSGIGGGFKLAVGAATDLLGTLTDLIANSPADEFRKQQTELTGLVGAIALANDNEAVRVSLLTELNQKYPEFLGKLSAESATTDILATRLREVNGLYEQKIRIALGEERIKKASDALTASIRTQSGALQELAKSSGKSITDLEKLSASERIALARRIGATETRPTLGMGVYTDSKSTVLANVLEASAKKQASAQAELNALLGENATRQTNLTKSTVEGYQREIRQIQEKIRLKQIDAKTGQAEIDRLKTQVDKTKGINRPVAAPSASALVRDRARVEQLRQEIENKRYEGITVPKALQAEYDRLRAKIERTTDTTKAHKAALKADPAADTYIDLVGKRLAEIKQEIASFVGLNPTKVVPAELLNSLTFFTAEAGRLSKTLDEIKPVDLGAKLKPLSLSDGPFRFEKTLTPAGLYTDGLAAAQAFIAKRNDLLRTAFNDLNVRAPGSGDFSSLNFYQSELSKIEAKIQDAGLKGLVLPKSVYDNFGFLTAQVAKSEQALSSARSQANLFAESLRVATLPSVDIGGLGGKILKGISSALRLDKISSALGLDKLAATLKLNVAFEGAKKVVANLPGFSNIIKIYDDSAATVEARTKALNSSLTSSIQGAAAGLATGFGELIGGMIEGTTKLAELPRSIGSVFGNLAKSMGQSLIAFGTAGLAAKSFVANPIGAIAAGIALTALGAALTASLQKEVKNAPGFAKGGLFRGESVIRVAENSRAIRGGGEWVSPVDLGADLISDRIMKNLARQPTIRTPDMSQIAPRSQYMEIGGEFRVRGSDLIVILERAQETGGAYN